MKKLLLVFMILTLAVFVMASCNKEDTSNQQNDNTNNADNTVEKACEHPEDQIVEVAAKAATCTENGRTEGRKCKECGKYVEGGNVIKAFEHAGTTITMPGYAATCEAPGKTDGKRCKACTEVILKQQDIAQLKHTPVANEDCEATCTEPGSTGGTHCSVCFNTLEAPTITAPIGSHNYELIAETEPTCQEDGIGSYICTNSGCGKVAAENVVIPKGEDYHNYVWTLDETDPTKENGSCDVEGCLSTTQRDYVAPEEE